MSEIKKPKKGPSSDWHPADIVASLRKAGWSIRQLSKHSGLAPGTLRHAIHSPYPKGEHLIADAIGVKPWEIWPSRYDASGQPNRGRSMREFKRHVNAKQENFNVKVNG